MLDLIKKTQANGVVFISGDVHWGEISKLNNETTYPIFDVTSSGITQTWYNTEPNQHRVGPVIPQNNIGMIEVQKINGKVQLKLGLFDITEEALVWVSFDVDSISF